MSIECNFLSLPDPLQQHILSSLDFAEIAQSSLVCKQFRLVAYDEVAWQLADRINGFFLSIQDYLQDFPQLRQELICLQAGELSLKRLTLLCQQEGPNGIFCHFQEKKAQLAILLKDLPLKHVEMLGCIPFEKRVVPFFQELPVMLFKLCKMRQKRAKISSLPIEGQQKKIYEMAKKTLSWSFAVREFGLEQIEEMVQDIEQDSLKDDVLAKLVFHWIEIGQNNSYILSELDRCWVAKKGHFCKAVDCLLQIQDKSLKEKALKTIATSLLSTKEWMRFFCQAIIKRSDLQQRLQLVEALLPYLSKKQLKMFGKISYKLLKKEERLSFAILIVNALLLKIWEKERIGFIFNLGEMGLIEALDEQKNFESFLAKPFIFDPNG